MPFLKVAPRKLRAVCFQLDTEHDREKAAELYKDLEGNFKDMADKLIEFENLDDYAEYMKAKGRLARFKGKFKEKYEQARKLFRSGRKNYTLVAEYGQNKDGKECLFVYPMAVDMTNPTYNAFIVTWNNAAVHKAKRDFKKHNKFTNAKVVDYELH